jgi:hypothetical protein
MLKRKDGKQPRRQAAKTQEEASSSLDSKNNITPGGATPIRWGQLVNVDRAPSCGVPNPDFENPL